MNVSEETEKALRQLHPALKLVVAVAAWAIPGAGHLLLWRWRRAIVFFLGVTLFAALGVLLRGHIFTFDMTDPFEMLGFLSNIGAGGYYFAAKYFALGAADVSRAAGDYGTRFFAAAGVLNFLCVLDALDIASARKE